MRSRKLSAAFSRVASAAPLFAPAMVGLVVGFLVAWRFAGQHAAAPVSPPGQISELEQAEELVDSEVKAWGEQPGVQVEYLYALSCMNFVQNSLRPGRFEVLGKQGKFPTPADAETCFRLKAGICGNQVQTFHELLSSFHLPIRHRSVEFYLHDEQHDHNSNHVVAEVFYGGGWHMFDITAGTVFLRPGGKGQDDLLSAEELRMMARENKSWHEMAICNAAATWFQCHVQHKVEIFPYVTWHDTNLLQGRDGIITLRRAGPGRRYSLENMPNMVGFTRDYNGNLGSLSFCLDGTVLENAEEGVLELTVDNVDPGKGAELWVTDGSKILHSIPITNEIKIGQVLRIPIPRTDRDLVLQVKSADASGWLGFRLIEVR